MIKMGSNASVNKSVFSSLKNRTISCKRLSKKEVEIIRQSWKDLNLVGDLKIHGLNMMIKVFTKNKDIRYIWKFAAQLDTEEEMRNSPQLKSHGNKIFEAFNAAVNSLDKIETLNSMLFKLGQRHKDYGSKAEHFPLLLDAFLLVLQEALVSKYNKEVENAWKKHSVIFSIKCAKEWIHEIQF